MSAQLTLGAEGLSQLASNDYLILASTFHSIHAIASRISPVPGSSGVEVIEAETFKMTCLQTPTGAWLEPRPPRCFAWTAATLCNSSDLTLTHRD